MSSQVNGRPTGPGGTVKDQEIAAEQRYVDIAYARLEEMRADAQAMIREGYRQSLAGTKGSLVDRDAMVHQAALRAQALDVADDGLVFGRLDLASREVRYIGRIGVRTSEHDSLVIDWRAPAAEDFYRATPRTRAASSAAGCCTRAGTRSSTWRTTCSTRTPPTG